MTAVLAHGLPLSVVIPTYRRLDVLKRCLEGVLGQDIDARSFEVIVVDDGHDDSVREYIESLRRIADTGPRVQYLRPATGRGPAVARNAGWRAAHGEMVAFTDDDTVPAPDWLREGVAALHGSPHWAALGGRIDVPRQHPGRPTDHELMTMGLEKAEFATANAFVWRAALEQVDGYDERFTRAWREDSDLQFRLMTQVGPVGHCRRAVVSHPVRPERWGVCLRQQRNIYFDALLYKKHPALYRDRIRPVPPWSYYLMVGLTIAALLSLAAGSHTAAATAASLVLALWLQFAAKRLWRTRWTPQHIGEMLATSAVIPFLSVYWRLRGAWHFGVRFL